MKQSMTIFGALVCLASAGYGQIVIDDGDMPSPGDTIRMSLTVNIPEDYTKTAADTVWDFSMLEPMSQRLDSFVNMNVVPNIYKLVFIPGFVANLAAPRNSNLALPGFAVSESYVFFKNNALGFSDAGYAFTVAGFPLPLKYDVPDLYYSFPLTFGSAWNSSSQTGLALPTFGYIGSKRVRSSVVDGWGTLITPYGTFETVRVKTELFQGDSIHLDTLGISIPINRQITEYKWLGKQQDEPLLQVNVEAGTATAIYRDLYRIQANPMSVSLGPDTSVVKGRQITLFPAVSNGVPPFRYIWSTFDTSSSLILTIDSTINVGVVAFDAFNNIAMDMVTISVKYAPGIDTRAPGFLGIRPNPSHGEALVSFPEQEQAGILTVCDSRGIPVLIRDVPRRAGQMMIALPGVPSGIYTVTLLSGNIMSTGKWIIYN